MTDYAADAVIPMNGPAKNIRQRLLEVRKAFRFLRKAKKVENYMAVTYDQLVGEVQDLFIDHGISVEPSLIEGKTIDTGAKSSKGNALWRFEGVFSVRFVNVDNSNDNMSINVPAHANDYGDKAPGKATTYATKQAMLKVLMTQTGENEEGRVGTEVSTDRIVELQKAMDDAAERNDKAGLEEIYKQAMAEARECQDNYAAKLFKKYAGQTGTKLNEFMPGEATGAGAAETGDAVKSHEAAPAPTPVVENAKVERVEPAGDVVAQDPASPGAIKSIRKAMERTGKTEGEFISKWQFRVEATPKSKVNEALKWAAQA
jgi:hypothetical protein